MERYKNKPDKPQKLLRHRDVLEKLSIGRTCLRENFVNTGRLRKIYITKKRVAYLEADVDKIIADLAAERNR